MTSKKKKVLFVYEGEDSEPWKDYIFQGLDSSKLPFGLEAIDSPSLGQISLDSYSVVTLILSPEMVTTLVDKAEQLSPLVSRHRCVSVILLCTTLEELNTRIVPEYAGADTWEILEMPTEENAQKITAFFVKLVEFLEKSTPKPARRSRTSRMDKIETVCPDCIRNKDENVVVVFKSEMAGEISVAIGTNTSVKVTKLNPYTIRFNAPAHPAGKARMEIRQDGKLIQSGSLCYKVSGLSGLEFIAQCLRLDPENLPELDGKLTEMYGDSLPGDYSLENMMKPETMSLVADTDEAVPCTVKFPTLLHLAARHGLSQLTAALLDTPGSGVAFQLLNKDGMNPTDLARKHHHEDLAVYMEDFLDTQSVVDLYLKMYEREYYNKEGFPRVPGYMLMGGKEDYILTRPGPDYVEESRSDEEDLAPLELTSPGGARVPSRKQKVRPPPVPDKLKVKAHSDEQEDLLPPPRDPKPFMKPTPPLKRSGSTNVEAAVDKGAEQAAAAPVEYPYPVTPEQFMNMERCSFFGPNPEPGPENLGSRCIAELEEIQQAFKKGDFTLDQVEMLFSSWKERNADKRTRSINERSIQLQELREKNRIVMEKVKKKKKGRFGWSKGKKASVSEPVLEIQHLGNTYSTLPRATGLSRASTISTSSTSSSSSCGSYAGSENRDSGLPATIPEFESDADTDQSSSSAVLTRHLSTHLHKPRSSSQVFEEAFEPPPRPPPPPRRPRKS